MWIRCKIGELMKVKGYRIEIEPLSEEDGGGFLATVPELPGCSSDGETPEEAASNVAIAVDGWIAMARKLGHKVPSPNRAYA